jgi:hypothetical protein
MDKEFIKEVFSCAAIFAILYIGMVIGLCL